MQINEYSNIIEYFSRCIKEETKEAIEFKITTGEKENVYRFNGEHRSNITDFFLGTKEYESIPSDTKLSNFVKILGLSNEHCYLIPSYSIHSSQHATGARQRRSGGAQSDKQEIRIAPLFYCEVIIKEDESNSAFRISKVEEEPIFNYGPLRLSDNETILLKDEIASLSDWGKKVTLYKGALEPFTEVVDDAPIVVIGNLPSIAEYGLLQELSLIKEKHLDKSVNTGLRFIFDEKPEFSRTKEYYDVIDVFKMDRTQEDAVRHCLENQFTVLKGPPGTGKSQVVANLLANIWFHNKTAFFVSKNNKAVNTVIEKFATLKTPYYGVLRLGNRMEKEQGLSQLTASLSRKTNHINETISYPMIEKLHSHKTAIITKISLVEKCFDDYVEISNQLLDKCQNGTPKLPIEVLSDQNTKLMSSSSLLELINLEQRLSLEKERYKANVVIKGTKEIALLRAEGRIQSLLDNIDGIISEYFPDIDRDADLSAVMPSLSEREKQQLLILSDKISNHLENKISLVEKIIRRFYPAYFKIYFDRKLKAILVNQTDVHKDKGRALLKKPEYHYFKDLCLYLIRGLEIKALYENRLMEMKQKEKLAFDIKQLDESITDRSLIPIKEAQSHIYQKLPSRFSYEEGDLVGERFYEQSLNHIRNVTPFVRRLTDLLPIIKETEDKRSQLLLQENIAELEKDLESVDNEIVSESRELLNYFIYKKINEDREILRTEIKDYYSCYAEANLSKLFHRVSKAFGIWVTTNLSAHRSVPLEPALFDYLIIDESSQNDIVSIIPLLFRAKNVVVIGDENQLKHISHVRDNTIKKIASETNVSARLNEFHYSKKSAYDISEYAYKKATKRSPLLLTNHYRSHRDIIQFSNLYIYNSNLLPIRYIDEKANLIARGIQWRDVKGYFVDKKNIHEAEAVVEFIRDEVIAKGSKGKIGIITPFRNQVNLIRNLLIRSRIEIPDLIVDTVHKFQGDEKDLIIYSPVISEGIKEGTQKWLDDSTELLNVAITRARGSLVIIGDADYCSQTDGMHSKLLKYAKSVVSFRKELIFEGHGVEKTFYEDLMSNGFLFEYQVPVYINNDEIYRIDFVMRSGEKLIGIELDGSEHVEKRSYDYSRDVFLRARGYKILRFSNSYYMNNRSKIMELLKTICSNKN